jgi:hypothetical protein
MHVGGFVSNLFSAFYPLPIEQAQQQILQDGKWKDIID